MQAVVLVTIAGMETVSTCLDRENNTRLTHIVLLVAKSEKRSVESRSKIKVKIPKMAGGIGEPLIFVKRGRHNGILPVAKRYSQGLDSSAIIQLQQYRPQYSLNKLLTFNFHHTAANQFPVLNQEISRHFQHTKNHFFQFH